MGDMNYNVNPAKELVYFDTLALQKLSANIEEILQRPSPTCDQTAIAKAVEDAVRNAMPASNNSDALKKLLAYLKKKDKEYQLWWDTIKKYVTDTQKQQELIEGLKSKLDSLPSKDTVQALADNIGTILQMKSAAGAIPTTNVNINQQINTCCSQINNFVKNSFPDFLKHEYEDDKLQQDKLDSIINILQNQNNPIMQQHVNPPPQVSPSPIITPTPTPTPAPEVYVPPKPSPTGDITTPPPDVSLKPKVKKYNRMALTKKELVELGEIPGFGPADDDREVMIIEHPLLKHLQKGNKAWKLIWEANPEKYTPNGVNSSVETEEYYKNLDKRSYNIYNWNSPFKLAQDVTEDTATILLGLSMHMVPLCDDGRLAPSRKPYLWLQNGTLASIMKQKDDLFNYSTCVDSLMLQNMETMLAYLKFSGMLSKDSKIDSNTALLPFSNFAFRSSRHFGAIKMYRNWWVDVCAELQQYPDQGGQYLAQAGLLNVLMSAWNFDLAILLAMGGYGGLYAKDAFLRLEVGSKYTMGEISDVRKRMTYNHPDMYKKTPEVLKNIAEAHKNHSDFAQLLADKDTKLVMIDANIVKETRRVRTTDKYAWRPDSIELNQVSSYAGLATSLSVYLGAYAATWYAYNQTKIPTDTTQLENLIGKRIHDLIACYYIDAAQKGEFTKPSRPDGNKMTRDEALRHYAIPTL